MATEVLKLKIFKSDELLFNDEETKEILLFFFPLDKNIINSADITNDIRGIAQALLVEAIDKSYAMGWVHLIADAFVNKGRSPTQLIKRIVKKGSLHWFKHAKATDLLHADIYDAVRTVIANNFHDEIMAILIAIEGRVKRPIFAHVNYGGRKA